MRVRQGAGLGYRVGGRPRALLGSSLRLPQVCAPLRVLGGASLQEPPPSPEPVPWGLWGTEQGPSILGIDLCLPGRPDIWPACPA